MGLFDRFKSKKETIAENDAVFLIQEVFELKEGGTVVAGEVLLGEILAGQTLSYVDKEGNKKFECCVEGMEQPDGKKEKASSDKSGKYKANYGLYIPDSFKEEFEKFTYLVSRPMQEEGRFTAFITEHKKKQEDAFMEHLNAENAKEEKEDESGKITESRKNGIGPIVFTETITDEMLADLSIQEMNFLICSLEHFNKKSALAGYQEKAKKLRDTQCKKLKEAKELYITYDQVTGFPFINEGAVDVYSKEVFAKDAVEHFGKMYRKLEVRKVDKDHTQFPDGISLFAFLYYIGVEQMIIDNGQYKINVQRADILPPPDYSNVASISVPAMNPGVRFAALNYLEELRWTVEYPGRAEKLKEKEEKMTEELCAGRYLLAMKQEGAVKTGENQMNFPKGGTLSFAKITNTNQQSFLPLFTDWTEFTKIYSKDDWSGMIVTIQDAVRIANGDGIAINPYGESLTLNQKSQEMLMGKFQELTAN